MQHKQTFVTQCDNDAKREPFVQHLGVSAKYVQLKCLHCQSKVKPSTRKTGVHFPHLQLPAACFQLQDLRHVAVVQRGAADATAAVAVKVLLLWEGT